MEQHLESGLVEPGASAGSLVIEFEPLGSGRVAGTRAGYEAERLEALHRLEILDTEAEQEYDDLVRLAAHICETPMALFSLVDRDRQWFKARVGFPMCQTSLSESVCAHTIAQSELLVVKDASRDARFREMPLVRSGAFRFYAGAPVTTADGYNVGSLCVLDPQPRELSQAQQASLAMLARQAGTNLRLRALNRELLREVRARIEVAEQLRKSKHLLARANHTLRGMANTDALTGLTNRRVLEEHMNGAHEGAGCKQEGLSVLMIDIDHFKRINDTLSHETGDRVLRRLARLLRSHTRASDTLCRYGGEEFVVLMPGADLAIASLRAERLRKAIVSDRQGPAAITVSIGVASRLPGDEQKDLAMLLREADRALYAAKQAGRDCVRISAWAAGERAG